ncbi:PREDICTED: pentatricopeptide repeat-containing protein At3g62470, mitochondrial-like [Erythranthe guttata]|uniref:pentatricopeptide repeat-containing protein At3g62470, mitochondrial-like n=1 Tax=Erythranthe guttata TaxID=4155 RepID=UPI00064DF33C|nr:PREDICTED: pentatricopeptide repeat-containing protein At3g62470, mitochondrial-like [Erythranthe guttata]|eukprot:XP_012840507.1 PREDICTED: pentatricopeptide repeat-containing protein At3g62470, mitochondrial-like [Erythranthe guttata]
MAADRHSSPQDYTLPSMDKTRRYEGEEFKERKLTVALCPCIFYLILLLVVAPIILVVKFHLPFCSDVNSVHTDSEFESDIENESASAEFEADLKEVERVCKRFNHARKPAFRFFCLAGDRPGFSHDSTTYNTMMNILGKTRQFETLVSLLEEMGEKGLLTMETFTMCIKVFAAAKERKKAVAIVNLMKKYNFKVGIETVNCLLDALGRAKLAKEAQTLFEKLEHKFAPNLKTYTILINGWCMVKNLMEAARMWNEMIDKGFKPDIVAHNIMLEGLLRSHTRSDAIKLFEVMKCKGPLPTVRSYSVLIKNICKHGHLKEAIDYFDEMVDSGCGPDAAMYTCLMTGFANQKKMDIVYRLLNKNEGEKLPARWPIVQCIDQADGE